MYYLNCLGCKEAGTNPTPSVGIRLVIDPRITMPGTPTLEGHSLGAAFMAGQVYVTGLIAMGLEELMKDYKLSREQLLVACWWAGLWGPPLLKKAWGQWAKQAGNHLWYGCIQIPDPPRKGDTSVANHAG